MSLRVLSAVSEAYPLAKTGGLGDVAGALPSALAPHDVSLTTFIPGYPQIMAALQDAEPVHKYRDLFGAEARLLSGTAGGLDVLVLDAPDFFQRDGGLYGDKEGRDWPDNWRRFGAFSRAAADIAEGRVGQGYDVLHAHDWQAALAAAYVHYDEADIPSIVTIHNIAFNGWFPSAIFGSLGLPEQAYATEGVEFYGGVGYLKAGLHTAHAITTVSPTYAEEICDPAFGMGLEGLIRARRDRLFGIVNGIDTSVWDPAQDPHLAASYDRRRLNLRRRNRAAIENSFGLTDGLGPLFCVISRLTSQKGMDVIAEAIDDIVVAGARLALIGTGDQSLENAFRKAADRHPGKIGVKIGYDESQSHLLQGGADAILIPSRFEPCGLTQLYGLRYGCVPIAARTGGLADTIIHANTAALATGVATGFLFDEVSKKGFLRAITHAISHFNDRKSWKSMQDQGMRADFSWKCSGARYAELYRRISGITEKATTLAAAAVPRLPA